MNILKAEPVSGVVELKIGTFVFYLETDGRRLLDQSIIYDRSKLDTSVNGYVVADASTVLPNDLFSAFVSEGVESANGDYKIYSLAVDVHHGPIFLDLAILGGRIEKLYIRRGYGVTEKSFYTRYDVDGVKVQPKLRVDVGYQYLWVSEDTGLFDPVELDSYIDSNAVRYPCDLAELKFWELSREDVLNGLILFKDYIKAKIAGIDYHGVNLSGSRLRSMDIGSLDSPTISVYSGSYNPNKGIVGDDPWSVCFVFVVLNQGDEKFLTHIFAAHQCGVDAVSDYLFANFDKILDDIAYGTDDFKRLVQIK